MFCGGESHLLYSGVVVLKQVSYLEADHRNLGLLYTQNPLSSLFLLVCYLVISLSKNYQSWSN